MNSAPGSERHDDKRQKHHNLLAAAILVSAGIVVAGVLLLNGDSGGGRRTESRATPVSGSPVSVGGQAEPRLAAFRGGSTPAATPGSSLRAGTATPRPATATPTRTPTPSPPKATATPAPKGTPQAPGEEPGDLELLADQDSFRYAVRKEWTGAIAADKLKVYQDIFEAIPGMAPAGSLKPDSPFVVEATGVYVTPDRLQDTTKIGQNKYVEWIVGTDMAHQLNGEPMARSTLPSAYTVLDYMQSVFVWDNGVWHWWDQDPDVDVRCRDSNEKVNGYKVRECFPFAYTSDQVFNLIDLLGGDSFQHYDSFSLQIWLLAEENIPTRMKLSVIGKDKDDVPEKMVLTLDVTDINSSSVAVDLPR